MLSNLSNRNAIRNRSQMLTSSKQNRKKKKYKPKPPWDSTVQDLNVFKPSPQELARNHDLHQPRKDHERLIKRINTAKMLIEEDSFDATPSIMEKKKALIKEVFYNQERELHKVLRETDRTLRDVKDIFGDDAMQKYQGKPNITKAPNSLENMDSFLSQLKPDFTSHYDTLSESIVRAQALNSLSDAEDGDSDNDSETDSHNTFENKMDLNRYQKLFNENPVINATPMPDVNCLSRFVNDFQQTISNKLVKQGNQVAPEICEERRKEWKKKEKNESGSANPLQSFEDMKKMLDVLENEISQYEQESGKENVLPKYQLNSSSLTGYTASLLSAIIRITHHLKESESQLRAEMSMRKEILDAFEEQRALVDALTADLLETQETNENLKLELHLQKKTSQTQYANLKLDLANLERKMDTLFGGNHPSLQQLSKPFVTFNETTIPSKPLQDISNVEGSYNTRKETRNKVSPMVSPIQY